MCFLSNTCTVTPAEERKRLVRTFDERHGEAEEVVSCLSFSPLQLAKVHLTTSYDIFMWIHLNWGWNELFKKISTREIVNYQNNTRVCCANNTCSIQNGNSVRFTPQKEFFACPVFLVTTVHFKSNSEVKKTNFYSFHFVDTNLL